MLPQAPSLLPHQTPPATRALRPRHPALTVFAVLPAEAERALAEVRAPPVHAGAPILAPDPVAEVPLSSAAWRQSRNPTRGPSLFPDADPAVGPLSPVSSGQRRVGPRPSGRAETQPSGHPASWLGRPGVGGRLAQQGHHPHSAGPPVPETVVHESPGSGSPPAGSGWMHSGLVPGTVTAPDGEAALLGAAATAP